MKLSAILAPLIAANVPGHVILETVKAFEDQQADALEKRRESDRKSTAIRRSRIDVSDAEWYALRAIVFERDGYVCAYCGDEEGPHEIDHILSLARGGTSHLSNLCVACRPCNASKGGRTVEEWRGGK